MSAVNLVIVESPAKAKTINQYLGKDFQVIASMGHVRDLSPKSGSVRPEENFAMTWLVNDRGGKQIANIAKAIGPQTKLYLATDPDREGEAISWHLTEELKRQNKLGKGKPQRIVFHEITQQAIKDAMSQPRDLNHHLIHAYLARRALDYLVGYSLSPILWRKLPGTKSAGRVQSVALRILVEREKEIRNFQSTDYWSLTALLRASPENGKPLSVRVKAQLTHEKGKRLAKLAIDSEELAGRYQKTIEEGAIILSSQTSKNVQRHPAPPFTTSTLQQEASRKLGLGASRTMQIAQQLYEAGYITYMRTDSTNLSGVAIKEARQYIGDHYGKDYLPENPRVYKTKSKNAQEAHEAVRPTRIKDSPEKLGVRLKPEQQGLYRLIWQRTVACQMASALLQQTTASFSVNGDDLTLTANGQIILFDGFFKLYQEGRDDEEEEERRSLPPLKQGEAKLDEVEKNQHATEPPPRYTEASLVKKMEEIGIGRPSTYANIIKVLQMREYVRLEKKRFFCENRGIVLSAFLTKYYAEYFNYEFTAKMEDELDDVSNGEEEWQILLKRFWQDFARKLGESEKLLHENIQSELQNTLTDFIFGVGEDAIAKQKCQKCKDGKLTLQLGTYGPYLSCSNYPDCDYKSSFERLALDNIDDANGMIYPKVLGQDDMGRDVLVKKGPYGFYVEQGLDKNEGEAEGKDDKKNKKKKVKKTKPKRTAIPKIYKPDEVTLPLAKKLLALPRMIGIDPNDKEEIIGSIGPYGAYLKKASRYYSIKGDDDVLDIGLNRAIDIIANAPPPKNEGRVLGEHPEGGGIMIKKGRWGYFLEWAKPSKNGKPQRKYAKLAAGTDAKNFSMDLALIIFPPKEKKTKTSGHKKI